MSNQGRPGAAPAGKPQSGSACAPMFEGAPEKET